MPWFGMDIGGTLTKLVFFEPTDVQSITDKPYEHETMRNIRRYLKSQLAYGDTGQRDDHLEVNNVNVTTYKNQKNIMLIYVFHVEVNIVNVTRSCII